MCCLNVKVWSLEKMLPIQTLHRHSDSVNAMVINGDLLLSGSEDTEIKVIAAIMSSVCRNSRKDYKVGIWWKT